MFRTYKYHCYLSILPDSETLLHRFFGSSELTGIAIYVAHDRGLTCGIAIVFEPMVAADAGGAKQLLQYRNIYR